MNSLEILTFTGVDGRTDPGALADIARQYPLVEFGILIGTHTDMKDRGIFPSLPIIDRFKNAAAKHSFDAALHLCGQHTRVIMGGFDEEDPLIMHSAMVVPPAITMQSLCDGFERVQVNLHGDHWDSRHIDVNAQRITAFAEWVTRDTSVKTVILQHRGSWLDVPVVHPRIEYLWDTSEGRGEDSIAKWPGPPITSNLADLRWGFAGGLGPHNMDQAMAFAKAYPHRRVWMDMEGKVRTDDGWFDLEKVRKVCAIAFPGG